MELKLNITKKVIAIITISLLIISCGKSKEEQMMYDYNKSSYLKNLNTNIDNRDFKIVSIDKIKDITANDSMRYYKKKFTEYWISNPSKELIDTLSFAYVKDVLKKSIKQKDTLMKLYQEAVLTAIKFSNVSYEYESKRKRDKATDDLFDYKKRLAEIEAIEKRYNNLSKSPNDVLSVKYKGTYDIKAAAGLMTYTKYYYTNKQGTEFIESEKTE